MALKNEQCDTTIQQHIEILERDRGIELNVSPKPANQLVIMVKHHQEHQNQLKNDDDDDAKSPTTDNKKKGGKNSSESRLGARGRGRARASGSCGSGGRWWSTAWWRQ